VPSEVVLNTIRDGTEYDECQLFGLDKKNLHYWRKTVGGDKTKCFASKNRGHFFRNTAERKCNGALHGRIRIRQNYIDWLPTGHQKMYRLKWEEFAAYAEDRNRKKKQRMTFVKAKARFA
jgi:hypothetical protein